MPRYYYSALQRTAHQLFEPQMQTPVALSILNSDKAYCVGCAGVVSEIGTKKLANWLRQPRKHGLAYVGAPGFVQFSFEKQSLHTVCECCKQRI